MKGEKGNAAPGPQLGRNMPVGLPFRLEVPKPFNAVRLKDKSGTFHSYRFCLIKPTWQHSCPKRPYNGGMNHGRWESNKVWQCHREVADGFCLAQSVLGLGPDGPSFGGLWTRDETTAPWSLCCRVQWTMRKQQWIRHYLSSRDKAGWSLLKLQWPQAWTLLFSIPCPR